MEQVALEVAVGREALNKQEVCRPSGEHLWGIILAGGEGRRLQPFIRATFGVERPKQYCAPVDHCSMLSHTLQRAERLIPPEHLRVIITDPHLRYAQEELHARPLGMLIVQPCNRDTGPGILLPLLHVYRRDPEAVVVLLPSDHFIREEARFMAAVGHAVGLVNEHPEYPVLLGAEPTSPEVEYGWIEPGQELLHRQGEVVYQVRRFWEKPSREQVAALYRRGYLWNTMVLVVRATVLLAHFQQLTPALMDAFAPISPALESPHEPAALHTAYAKLPSINFSQAILARRPPYLGVLRVQGVYWSDWGDPARIQAARVRFALANGGQASCTGLSDP
jgi:mannose-1-phosphate guanylyltransferase